MEVNIIQIPDKPHAIIFQFSGEMDSDQIGMINDTFSQINSNINYVIVNVKSVQMISSSVIGELMGYRKQMIERGGDLVIAGIDFSIRTKLNLIGLTKIFRIFSDPRSALNAYRWEIERHAEKIHVSFPSHLKIVPPVRQLISRIAKQKGYGNRDSFRLETIVDEICNNAVEHGMSGSELSIKLNMEIDPEKVELDVTNTSDPEKMASLKALLKPKNNNDIKLDERRGRGLALIKMLTDELSVDCSGTGTSVHIKKVREE